jgi:sulfoacetaldehyde acetyltransferase
MQAVSEADPVLAVGSRLNPFGTLPQYGFDYWPQRAQLIQVDVDPTRLSLTKSADVEVLGDARLFLKEMTHRVISGGVACGASASARLSRVAEMKAQWKDELDRMTIAEDSVHPSRPGFLKPRAVLRELEKAMPVDAIVSTDIGNICSVANSYLHFEAGRQFLAPMTFGNCGYSSPAVMGAKVARPDRPCVGYSGDGAWGMQMMDLLTAVRERIPFTQVVFNNGQWGAEKKNQVLWFGDRYVGTNLQNPSFSAVACAMGARGVRVDSLDQVGAALHEAVSAQMKDGNSSVIEVMCTKELGDPFRRDAMKLPRRHLAKYKGTEEFDESATGQPVDPRC